MQGSIIFWVSLAKRCKLAVWISRITYSSELAGDFVEYLAKERRTWLNGRFVRVGYKRAEEKRDDAVQNEKLKFILIV